MQLTGQLGTPQSQPGHLVPGYRFTGICVWKGPFPTALVPGYPFGGGIELAVTGTLTGVSTAIAQQLAASDPSWWEFH